MSMIGIAVAIHVLSVLWWIGGLAFVSTVALPELRRDPETALQRFRDLEHRFAPQVRIALIVVGTSGGWLLQKTDLWRLMDKPVFWWLDAMVAFWVLFMLMLFVLGPSGVLRRIMSGPMNTDLPMRLKRMHWLHVGLLVVGVVIILGAVASNHG